MGMFPVLTGVLAGLIAVIPLGPMSMSVIGVSTMQGRRAGLRAAAGVVGGDLVATTSAAALVLVGHRLPGGVLPSIRLMAPVVLAVIALTLIVRAERVNAVAAGIRRPGPLLFLFTAVSPLTLGTWFALLLASPFVGDGVDLGLFVVGLILGSGVWHPLLAFVASLGIRLSRRGATRLVRFGGGCMLGLATVFASGHGSA